MASVQFTVKMHQIIKTLLNLSTEENVFYSATVSNPKKLSGQKKFLCQAAKNFQFTKTVSGQKKFEKLNTGWETKKKSALFLLTVTA